MTVDDSGAIIAMTVGGDQFAETKGLGAKAREESFTSQFIGKKGTVALGTDVDAISGATITTEAVVKGVNEALKALAGAPDSALPDAAPEATSTPEATAAPEVTAVPEGRTVSATKDGFESPIEVVITVDGEGRILTMTVGKNASFDETEGLGTKVKDRAFIDQFIGKTGPFEIGQNIDAVTGATYSSKGVVEAVNAALESLKGGSNEQPPAETKPIETGGKTVTVTVDGFAGKIDVTVTMEDSGAIIAMAVGGSKFAETPGLGAKAREESFTFQFIGKKGTVALGTDVDAISGATITSEAVVKGVNEALKVMAGTADTKSAATTGTEPSVKSEATSSLAPELTSAPEATPAAAPEATAAPEGRTARATKEGFESPIEVVITVDEAGRIIAMTVGKNADFDETEGLGTNVKGEAFIAQFIGQTGPFELAGNIDTVAGATFSSKAVVDAVNEALESLRPAQTVVLARSASATKEGFLSPIEVMITVDEAGRILTMTVGQNASFDETEGLGTKVKDEAFIAQFLGQTGPFALGGNIDAVTGATYSSKGVVEAVNAALESLVQ